MAWFYTVAASAGASFCGLSGFDIGKVSYNAFLEVGFVGHGIFETIFAGDIYYSDGIFPKF